MLGEVKKERVGGRAERPSAVTLLKDVADDHDHETGANGDLGWPEEAVEPLLLCRGGCLGVWLVQADGFVLAIACRSDQFGGSGVDGSAQKENCSAEPENDSWEHRNFLPSG